MTEDPWLEILQAMWVLEPSATPLERLLAWRPTTGDGWRFRAQQLAKLRREQSGEASKPR
jgi:hypothetical protein